MAASEAMRAFQADLAEVTHERDILRAVLIRVASRLANHAYCDEHSMAEPDRMCGFCADRDAYQAYLVMAQGPDFQVEPSGSSVTLTELSRRAEG